MSVRHPRLAVQRDRRGAGGRGGCLFCSPADCTPTDIAVLHLDTGQLDTVPGIELWAKAGTGLLISPDSRWLIIGLDEGTGTSLLLWHSGLSYAAVVVEVPGLTRDTTPLTAPVAALNGSSPWIVTTNDS